MYDDQNLLEVDDLDSLVVEQLRSLGRLVRVGVVHRTVDHLHPEQNDHGYNHSDQLIFLDVSPLLHSEMELLHVPDTIFTDHDGYLTPVWSGVNPTDTFLQGLAIDWTNLRTFLGRVYSSDVETDSLVHVCFKI